MYKNRINLNLKRNGGSKCLVAAASEMNHLMVANQQYCCVQRHCFTDEQDLSMVVVDFSRYFFGTRQQMNSVFFPNKLA